MQGLFHKHPQKQTPALYAGFVLWYDKEHPFKIKFIPSVNELGIYQMSGNVAEWCMDYYGDDFYSESEHTHNPLNTSESSYHVVRGGGFDDDELYKVTVYYRETSNKASKNIGLRLVLNQ